MSYRWLFVSTLFLILTPFVASAHRMNESYIYFNVTDETLLGRFEATLEDLDRALSIDDDGDGTVTEDELRNNETRVFQFFQGRFALTSDGQDFPISYSHVSTLGSALGKYAQVWFTIPGLSPTPDHVDVAYAPLADVLGAGHSGFVLIESNTRLQLESNESYISLVFETADGSQSLSLVGEPLGKLFVDFVEHGVWHIWLGFDHVVFLVTLLLAAVMLPKNGRWEPLESFRPAMWNVLGIVTVFTISHSITLSLAALGIVQLPVTLVESIIALSIAVVAIMNLFPTWHQRVLWVVFAFGLFHGFGFANVLAPLGLSPAQVLVGLVAFNIGVELGQIAIVLVAFPLLWALRRWSLYPPLALKFGSVALVALAAVWLLERTTDFEWDIRGTIDLLVGTVT